MERDRRRGEGERGFGRKGERVGLGHRGCGRGRWQGKRGGVTEIEGGTMSVGGGGGGRQTDAGEREREKE